MYCALRRVTSENWNKMCILRRKELTSLFWGRSELTLFCLVLDKLFILHLFHSNSIYFIGRNSVTYLNYSKYSFRVKPFRAVQNCKENITSVLWSFLVIKKGIFWRNCISELISNIFQLFFLFSFIILCLPSLYVMLTRTSDTIHAEYPISTSVMVVLPAAFDHILGTKIQETFQIDSPIHLILFRYVKKWQYRLGCLFY